MDGGRSIAIEWARVSGGMGSRKRGSIGREIDVEWPALGRGVMDRRAKTESHVEAY